MTNPKLRIFFLAQSFAYAYFWVAIGVPYLLYRGLSGAEVFSIMSIYQLFGVLLEYPTGIIGDRFGYLKVTYLSNLCNLVAMLLLVFPGGYLYYLGALFILAIGNGFSSGNDMGLLKAVSKNIQKDTANYNSLVDFVIFVSAIVGGLLSRISYELAIMTSGILMFLANVPLYILRHDFTQNKSTLSIAQIIKDGARSLRLPLFRQLFLVVALVGGYSFAVKNIVGGYGERFGIGVATIGFLVGLTGLGRAIGSKLYAEFPVRNIAVPSIIFVFSVVGIGVFPGIVPVVTCLLLTQILAGYLGSKIDGDIHEAASDHTRASLFSLKRVSMKLTTSGYLAVYGIALGISQATILAYLTGILLLSAFIYSWQYLRGHDSLK